MRATANDLFEQSFQVVHVWIRAFLQDNRWRNRRGVYTLLGPSSGSFNRKERKEVKARCGRIGDLSSNVTLRWRKR